MISESIVLLLLALPVPDIYGCNLTPARTATAINSINMVGHYGYPLYIHGMKAKHFVNVDLLCGRNGQSPGILHSGNRLVMQLAGDRVGHHGGP